MLTSSPSACISTQSRTFSSITSRSPRLTAPKTSVLPLQRRFLADEAAATQSEPEADGAELTQDANNSIANASSSEPAEPPKTEEQAAQAVAQDSASTNTATPEGSSATSTIADAARSAARSASHAASGAASTVAETASTAGQSLGQAAGFGNSPAYGEPSTTVYVGNLFFDVRSDDLKKEFERAGSVKEARIISDQRGLSKGLVSPSSSQVRKCFDCLANISSKPQFRLR